MDMKLLVVKLEDFTIQPSDTTEWTSALLGVADTDLVHSLDVYGVCSTDKWLVVSREATIASLREVLWELVIRDGFPFADADTVLHGLTDWHQNNSIKEDGESFHPDDLAFAAESGDHYQEACNLGGLYLKLNRPQQLAVLDLLRCFTA